MNWLLLLVCAISLVFILALGPDPKHLLFGHILYGFRVTTCVVGIALGAQA